MESLNIVNIAISIIVGIATFFATIWAMKREFKEELKEVYDPKFQALAAQIEALEEKTKQETDHIRMTYNSEVKNLGEKIEHLREEVRDQHKQIINLLTELIREK